MRPLNSLMPLALMAAFVLGGPAARAAQSDPAAAQIESFDASLIAAMKEGQALGAKGRYRRLAPAVERAFDLPLMTRIAVGPAWTAMPQADHAALVEAFTRLSVASYAHNFTAYGGERFEIEPGVEARGSDKIVQTRLIPAHGAAVNLTYRMRQTGGDWKIIDVSYDAISQLTMRRSDFAAPLAAGGAKGLVAHLNGLVDKLLK
jgi:phospholipid transport system substrate-binding protein